MKIYQIIHNVWNRRGKITFSESYVIGFNNVSELSYHMKGKWAMCENNESYVAYELN